MYSKEPYALALVSLIDKHRYVLQGRVEDVTEAIISDDVGAITKIVQELTPEGAAIVLEAYRWFIEKKTIARVTNSASPWVRRLLYSNSV
jgi:hypothetical protein